VSAEGFALSGDVHVWRGDLSPADYEAATPDGRLASRRYAGERLARVVCADREMLDEDAISRIAAAVAEAQEATISRAIRDLREAHRSIATAIVTGLGAVLGARAAVAAGLCVASLSEHLGADGARSAPATAVALLLHEHLRSPVPPQSAGSEPRTPFAHERRPVTVVKLGGSLLAHPDQWRAATSALKTAATSQRLVVVPGGGPFADAVRHVDDTFRLTDDAAHWMAIAGMDQHAEMIAAAGNPFVRVDNPGGIVDALAGMRIAVVAPLRWLRESDPLPHSWDITSDSIAAWIAGQVGATRLVVIKSGGATGPAIVDAGFHRTRPPDLPWTLCDAWELAAQLAVPEPSPR
jgi:aspartokinase-like uncharacterized kinase